MDFQNAAVFLGTTIRNLKHIKGIFSCNETQNVPTIIQDELFFQKLLYVHTYWLYILVGQKTLYDNASFKSRLEHKNVIIKFLCEKRLVAGLSSFSLASEDETSNAVSLIILAKFIPSFLDFYNICSNKKDMLKVKVVYKISDYVSYIYL